MDLEISKFIADNPKRAIVREALNHAAHYACEYCTSKATRTTIVPKPAKEIQKITAAINFLKNMSGSSEMANTKEQHLQSLYQLKSHLSRSKNRTHNAWPQSTASQGQPRTDAMTDNICLLYTSPSPRD